MPFLKIWISEALKDQAADMNMDAQLFLQAACRAWKISETAMLVCLDSAQVISGNGPVLLMELDSFIPDPPQIRQVLSEVLTECACRRYGLRADQVFIRFSDMEGFGTAGQYVSR